MPPDQGWLRWLEQTAVAAAMRESLWLYPIVEIGHILGFVVLVGAAVLFDLRLLGLSRTLPVVDMERHLLRWARLSVLVVVPTGILLFMADPVSLAANSVFRLKLVLLAAAGLNAAVFHLVTFRSIQSWNTNSPSPAGAKISAVLSLVFWIGVISCGRLLAYV